MEHEDISDFELEDKDDGSIWSDLEHEDCDDTNLLLNMLHGEGR